MSALTAALNDPVRRSAVVRDAGQLLEAEVASKRGLRGGALKAGFSAFKAVQPGIVEQAIDKLLPHFAPVMDPWWTKAAATKDPVAYLCANDGAIADGLLAVTDGLAERAQNRVLKRIYTSLRGQARGHVVDGIPGLARLMARHARS